MISFWRLNSLRRISDGHENWFIYLPSLRLCQSPFQARKVTADCKLWQLKLRSWQQNTTQAAGNHQTCLSLSLSLSPIRPVSLLPGGVFIWYYWCVAGPGPGCDVRVSRMSLDVTDVSLLSAPFIWLHHRPDNCNLRLSNWLLSSEAEQGRGWNFLINNPSS